MFLIVYIISESNRIVSQWTHHDAIQWIARAEELVHSLMFYYRSELIGRISVFTMDIPVKMKRCDFSIVPFVVGEIKMIWQSLLFPAKP